MAIRICAAALALPVALFALLMAFPSLDRSWGTFSFHFYVVSAASLLAALVCVALIISARSVRQTRILFLVLCFFSLGMVFAVHGLTTPGHLYHAPTAAIERSPWISTLLAGIFVALSVMTIPRFMEKTRLRLPEITFVACAGLVCLYFVASLAFPNWLEGFPTREAWFRYLLTAITIGLLSFAAWRYLQSYQFARLPGQLAVMVGLLFLAEAQVSLTFGRFWQYSWWMYHALFPMAFVSVLAGWGWEMVVSRNPRAVAEALAMRDALSQLNRGRPADLVALADQIENHDPETMRHVDRVATMAYAVGKEMGFNAGRLRDLVLAAQMHDVGKIGLPPYILTKPGRLTEDEFSLVKQHPGKGQEIVRRAAGPLDKVARFIRHHHERFDGLGYPDGLSGDQIPLESRIISVVDTFDALTSQRAYRETKTPAEAKEELMRVAGTQLDPRCVEAFLKALQKGKPKKPAPQPEAIETPAS